MKLATTTGDLVYYTGSPATAVKMFEGTGFKHLDYSFWRGYRGDKPILKDDWLNPVKEAKKEAEKLGFDFVQAHSPGANFLECTEKEYEEIVLANIRSIEACGYLGIKKIVVHSGVKNDLKYKKSLFNSHNKEKYFELNKPFFERLYPAMEKYGVKVLIENSSEIITRGRYFFMTGEEMAEFIDYCGHPLLGACWDTGHGNLRKKSAYDDLIALGNKLEAVHIQDNFGKHDDHLVPYTGTLDIDSVMNGLIDTKFIERGCYFTFECDNIISRNGACIENRGKDDRFKPIANEPTAELKQAAVKFMYEIGKNILTAYNCFEE